jgi:hypothetical protein
VAHSRDVRMPFHAYSALFWNWKVASSVRKRESEVWEEKMDQTVTWNGGANNELLKEVRSRVNNINAVIQFLDQTRYIHFLSVLWHASESRIALFRGIV